MCDVHGEGNCAERPRFAQDERTAAAIKARLIVQGTLSSPPAAAVPPAESAFASFDLSRVRRSEAVVADMPQNAHARAIGQGPGMAAGDRTGLPWWGDAMTVCEMIMTALPLSQMAGWVPRRRRPWTAKPDPSSSVRGSLQSVAAMATLRAVRTWRPSRTTRCTRVVGKATGNGALVRVFSPAPSSQVPAAPRMVRIHTSISVQIAPIEVRWADRLP